MALTAPSCFASECGCMPSGGGAAIYWSGACSSDEMAAHGCAGSSGANSNFGSGSPGEALGTALGQIIGQALIRGMTNNAQQQQAQQAAEQARQQQMFLQQQQLVQQRQEEEKKEKLAREEKARQEAEAKKKFEQDKCRALGQMKGVGVVNCGDNAASSDGLKLKGVDNSDLGLKGTADSGPSRRHPTFEEFEKYARERRRALKAGDCWKGAPLMPTEPLQTIPEDEYRTMLVRFHKDLDSWRSRCLGSSAPDAEGKARGSQRLQAGNGGVRGNEGRKGIVKICADCLKIWSIENDRCNPSGGNAARLPYKRLLAVHDCLTRARTSYEKCSDPCAPGGNP